MRYKLMGIAMLVLSVALSGCASQPEEEAAAAATYPVSSESKLTAADPSGAVKAVYATLKEHKEEKLNAETAEEIVGISSSEVVELHAYVSDVKYGLCDIIIAKPLTSNRDDVREYLYKYKEQRIREFENYDILNAYSIAQNAVVYDQGDYVILLMLEDNEAAKVIIDEYIPQ